MHDHLPKFGAIPVLPSNTSGESASDLGIQMGKYKTLERGMVPKYWVFGTVGFGMLL